MPAARVLFSADLSGLKRAYRDAESDTERTVGKIEARYKQMASNLSGIGRAMSLAITAPLVIAGGLVVKAAMNAVESENLFTVSMGKMAAAGRAWSDQLSKDLRLNQYEVRKFLGTMQVMTQSMGMSQDSAYALSKQMVQLAYDMASFYNLSTEDAFQKLQSGLSGEIEPLRRLGISITELDVKRVAYRAGIAKEGQELTQLQKVQARGVLIMQSTIAAQGDLARTLDSPANRARALKSRMEELAVSLGQKLLPATVTLMEAADRLITGFNNLSPTSQKLILTLAGITAAAGPAASAIGAIYSASAMLSGSALFAGSGTKAASHVASRVSGWGLFKGVHNQSAATGGVSAAVNVTQLTAGARATNFLKAGFSGLWATIRTGAVTAVRAIAGFVAGISAVTAAAAIAVVAIGALAFIIYRLVTAKQRARKAALDHAAAVSKEKEELLGQAQTVQGLIEQYSELAKKNPLTQMDKWRMQDILVEIGSKYPDLIDDKTKDKLKKNAEDAIQDIVGKASDAAQKAKVHEIELKLKYKREDIKDYKGSFGEKDVSNPLTPIRTLGREMNEKDKKKLQSMEKEERSLERSLEMIKNAAKWADESARIAKEKADQAEREKKAQEDIARALDYRYQLDIEMAGRVKKVQVEMQHELDKLHKMEKEEGADVSRSVAAVKKLYGRRILTETRAVNSDIAATERENAILSARLHKNKYDVIKAEAEDAYQSIARKANELTQTEGKSSPLVKRLYEQAALSKRVKEMEAQELKAENAKSEAAAKAAVAVSELRIAGKDREADYATAKAQMEAEIADLKKLAEQGEDTSQRQIAAGKKLAEFEAQMARDKKREQQAENIASRSISAVQFRLQGYNEAADQIEAQIQLQERLNDLKEQEARGVDTREQQKLAEAQYYSEMQSIERKYANDRLSLFQKLSVRMTELTKGERAARRQELDYERQDSKRSAAELIKDKEQLGAVFAAIDADIDKRIRDLNQPQWTSLTDMWKYLEVAGAKMRGMISTSLTTSLGKMADKEQAKTEQQKQIKELQTHTGLLQKQIDLLTKILEKRESNALAYAGKV